MRVHFKEVGFYTKYLEAHYPTNYGFPIAHIEYLPNGYQVVYTCYDKYQVLVTAVYEFVTRAEAKAFINAHADQILNHESISLHVKE